MIIRPIRLSDLDALVKLASKGGLGITNLPQNRHLLEAKIQVSLNAFSKAVTAPENEQYIFVLEDLETGNIGGTCSVISKTGLSRPVYFYRIETISLKKDPKEIQILRAVSYKKTPSEIVGLYLDPDFRKAGHGKLLSLSRLLFVATFQERFTDSFFSEIRGVIGTDGIAPFWEAIGRHFFNLEYQDLMKLAEAGRGFIHDILPKHPIYMQLLAKEAQEIIGKPHEQSQAAFSMLEAQGFKFMNEVDIFDGGPRIVAKTSKIKTIKTSVKSRVCEIVDEDIDSKVFLIGNEKIDFRAGYGKLKLIGKDGVVMERKVAEALHLSLGDSVRYVSV